MNTILLATVLPAHNPCATSYAVSDSIKCSWAYSHRSSSSNRRAAGRAGGRAGGRHGGTQTGTQGGTQAGRNGGGRAHKRTVSIVGGMADACKASPRAFQSERRGRVGAVASSRATNGRRSGYDMTAERAADRISRRDRARLGRRRRRGVHAVACARRVVLWRRGA
jgi:hypothetical protein